MGPTELLMAVDGERHHISNPDPTSTLSDYLRSNGFTAAKIGCSEGGCGSCMVTVASWDAEAQAPVYRSINSCLQPLCKCHGLSVTTSKGLGNSQKGFHPIQERLAEHNGSQCGFCSPGMVMSIFGMLSSHPGETCPDEARLETSIDGNLCRCTGYRPILAAARSFAGAPKSSVAGDAFAPYPEFLKQETLEEAQQGLERRYTGSGKEWISPATMQQLQAAMGEERPGKSVSLIAGHTCRGIYKDDHLVDVFVDVSRIQELIAVETTAEGVRLGGAVTWSTFIDAMEKGFATEKPETAAFAVLVEHARKVAGHGVRNLGTLGGNIAMTKARGFQSDLTTILAGVGASVTVCLGTTGHESVDMQKFFSSAYQLAPGAVIESVFVPYAEKGEVFKSFRTALRPINSHALANAAFSICMDGDKITKSRLVFGGFESRGAAAGPDDPNSGFPCRAERAEAVIAGKAISTETMLAALEALPLEPWWPQDELERHLAQGFLFKMFFVLHGGADATKGPPLGVSQSSERPATKGTQLVTWAEPELKPIGEAMPKMTSKIQAAGEQRFTNDVPEPQGCLYAAYVCIPHTNTVFTGYSLEVAEKMPGFFGVVDAADIPGANTCELTFTHTLLVPQGGSSQYAGHPCLILLADSTRHAEAAAAKVTLQLEAPQTPPVVSIKTAREREAQAEAAGEPSRLQKPKEVKRGDVVKALEASHYTAKGVIQSDGQKAFYMEPPCALAIPGEDRTIEVWGNQQVTSWAQERIAKNLGISNHKIVAYSTHIGGGFGGKLMKSLHVSCAVAVAAVKTQRPVRLHLNRNVDTRMCGGRHNALAEYEVGFTQAGTIEALRVTVYSDGGKGDACNGFATAIMVTNLEQIYGIPNVDLAGILVKTDKAGNTAVRGPGEPQCSFIIESVMEHVAEELGKSSQEVREANIFTSREGMQKVAADPTSAEVEQYSALLAVTDKDGSGNDLKKGFPALGIWTHLKERCGFEAKEKEVARFNSSNRWRKRGLAMVPVKYAMGHRSQQALVCLYGDGSCLITCDGTEIGQGLHTKVAQYAAYYLSQIVPNSGPMPVEKIRFGPVGTDKIAIGSITGGSTTSEGVAEAVRDAIEKLAEGMRPFKEQLDEKGAPYTLVDLITKAKGSTEMQASGKNKVKGSYHCYGAAAAEVEVDVLTGETVIRSVDMLYDCGKSLNPTIDLGQCEGAFMMGVGFFLREQLVQDEQTGQLNSDGTFWYKIPCFQDVPLQFNVEFFPRAFTEGANIACSKASGEPPLVLSSSVFCALRQAVRAGQKEFGTAKGPVTLDAPCTPRDIVLAIGATSVQEKLQLP